MDARGEYAAEIEIRRLRAERDALVAQLDTAKRELEERTCERDYEQARKLDAQHEMARLKAERDSVVEQVAYWRERAVGAEAEESGQ